MNPSLDNKYAVLHLGERTYSLFPLLQPLMGIASILLKVLCYFELDGYKYLRRGGPACTKGQGSHLLKHRPLKSFMQGKSESSNLSILLKWFLTSMCWFRALLSLVCPFSVTLLSRSQRFNFSSPQQTQKSPEISGLSCPPPPFQLIEAAHKILEHFDQNGRLIIPSELKLIPIAIPKTRY